MAKTTLIIDPKVVKQFIEVAENGIRESRHRDFDEDIPELGKTTRFFCDAFAPPTLQKGRVEQFFNIASNEDLTEIVLINQDDLYPFTKDPLPYIFCDKAKGALRVENPSASEEAVTSYIADLHYACIEQYPANKLSF